jgi:hypothetical protein
MTSDNGDATPGPPSSGHDCDELCGGAGKPCECPPCNCPDCIERTARATGIRPDVEDIAPRPGPPESLF